MDLLGLLGWAALAVTATAIFLGFLLVILPVQIEAQSSYRNDRFHLSFDAHLGFGLITIQRLIGRPLEVSFLGFFRWTVPRPKKSRAHDSLKTAETRERILRKTKKNYRRLKAGLPHWRAFAELGRRLLSSVKLRLDIFGTVGFDDPADTVIFFAILNILWPRFDRVQLQLERDYFDEILDLEARLEARVWLVQLGLLGLSALMRRETRHALLAVR